MSAGGGGPTVRLPKKVDEALDGLMARDRRWFEENPTVRWRIRPTEHVERESDDLIAIATNTEFSDWQSVVCVVRPPEVAGIRFRVSMSPDYAVALVFDIASGTPHMWVSRLIAAQSDAEFFGILRQNLEAPQ